MWEVKSAARIMKDLKATLVEYEYYITYVTLHPTETHAFFDYLNDHDKKVLVFIHLAYRSLVQYLVW